KKVEAASLTKEKPVDGAIELRFDQGLAQTMIAVPADGRYELRVRGRQEKSPEGRAIVGIRVDGVDTGLVNVPSEEGVYSTSFELQRGERRLAIHHTPPKAYDAKKDVIPDTRLFLKEFEIAGPERSASHQRIV